jgi:hypothetical protein
MPEPAAATPKKTRRAYSCKQCGQPKKSHTCTAAAAAGGGGGAAPGSEGSLVYGAFWSTATCDALAEAWAAEVTSGADSSSSDDDDEAAAAAAAASNSRRNPRRKPDQRTRHINNSHTKRRSATTSADHKSTHKQSNLRRARRADGAAKKKRHPPRTVSTKLRQMEFLLPWYEDPRSSSPPEFAGKRLCERPVRSTDGRFVTYGEFTLSTADFDKMAARWEKDYPSIVEIKEKLPPVRKRRSTPDKTRPASSSGPDTETKQNTKPAKTTTHKCTRHETMDERSRITAKPEIRAACWAKLPICFDLPSKYRDVFKVDMYGNVVAKGASDGALCFFDVDHVFPWSRGGRSVMSNFEAVQCFANRSVKSDRLHPTILDSEILVGLTLPELQGLLALVKGRGRNFKRKHDDLMAWLCNTPMKGRSLGAGFRGAVECCEGDAGKLFRWFLKRQHEDDTLLYGEFDDKEAAEVGLEVEAAANISTSIVMEEAAGGKEKAIVLVAAAAVPVGSDTAKGKETRKNALATTTSTKKVNKTTTVSITTTTMTTTKKKKKKKWKKKAAEESEFVVGNKPSIGFCVTATSLNLCGTKTYAVKDEVLKPLKFRWDRRKKLWWRPIKSRAEARALLREVERRLFDQDIGLKMMVA